MFNHNPDKELLQHYRFIIKNQNQIIESLLELSRRQRVRIEKLAAPTASPQQPKPLEEK